MEVWPSLWELGGGIGAGEAGAPVQFLQSQHGGAQQAGKGRTWLSSPTECGSPCALLACVVRVTVPLATYPEEPAML